MAAVVQPRQLTAMKEVEVAAAVLAALPCQGH